MDTPMDTPRDTTRAQRTPPSNDAHDAHDAPDRPATVYVLRIRDQVGRTTRSNARTLDPAKLDAVPCYVKRYDPRAFNNRGEVDFTDDVREALHFTTRDDAFACYMQKVGKRADGAWNRPLTAFTVSIEPVTLPAGTTAAAPPT